MATSSRKKLVAATKYKLSLGVDAGNILFADMGYLIKNGVEDFVPHADDAGALAVLSLPAGPQTLRVRIDTDPATDERFEIVVASGRLYVGDASHAFSDDDAYQRFLKKSKYLAVANRHMKPFDTGGDGEFRVVIEILPQ